jgi:hypothetical protein
MNSRTIRANCLLLSFALFAPMALSKGGGVGYWLEGTIADLRVDGNVIALVVKGRLWLDQYLRGPESRQAVEFECKKGIAGRFSSDRQFFAMSSDGGAGALRSPGQLKELLQLAAKRGTKVKFELQNVQIDFRDWQCPAVTADVIRATDVDLK